MTQLYKHPTSHGTIALGRQPKRTDPRTFQLSKYLKAVPPPPKTASFWAKVTNWPMFLNDNLGDCVLAASGHMIQQWTAYGSHEQTVNNQQILKAYEDIGGYVPGQPFTDTACDMLTALNYWRKTGIGGHKILAYAALNPQDRDQVKQAIALFGNCYFGIGLPLSAQPQVGGVWAVPPGGPVGEGTPYTWGGHCLPGINYDDFIVHAVTWGDTQMMTWNFIEAYCDEAYAVLSADFMEANGVAPSGLDLAALQADLAAL